VERSGTSLTRGRANKSIFALLHVRKISSAYPGTKIQVGSVFRIRKNQTQIAGLLGVHKSTISRELSRNVPKRGIGAKIYIAVNAQVKTEVRHHDKPKHTTFSISLKNQMKDWMVKKRYSPALVSAQWKKDGIKGVSHECIYNFIWDCKHTNKRINIPFKGVYK